MASINYPKRKIKPGKGFYVLAVFMLIVGILLTALLVYKVFYSNIQKVIAPSESDVQISSSGDYMIYNEYDSVIDGDTFYSSEKFPDLIFNLYSKETGEEIELVNAKGADSYNISERKGVSLYKFSINEPGSYHLSALYPDETEHSKVVLTIQKKLMEQVKVLFIKSLLINLLFGGSACAIAIITYKKRKKAMSNKDL